LRTEIATGLLVLSAIRLLFSQAMPGKPSAAERFAIDAIVTDSTGHVVPGLTAADFELSHNGQPLPLADVAFLQTPPANTSVFNIVPWPGQFGENDLTIVLVLDDLRLSTEARTEVRRAVERFIDGQMQPRERAAIVRTTSGTGALQQLSSDKHLLHAALDLLSRQAPDASHVGDLKREDDLAEIALAVLRPVLDGLRPLAGRKAVVLFSENMKLFAGTPTDSALLAARANRSSVVFYTLDPRGLAAAARASQSPEQIPASAGLGALARDTGGIFFDNTNDCATALARVLEDQKGYYRIAFSPEKSAEPSYGGQLIEGISVKAKRSGLLVRSRHAFPRVGEAEANDEAVAPFSRLLPPQPFASGGIRMRLTPLVSYDRASSLDALLQIDPQNVAFTSGSQGLHQAELELEAVAVAASGASAGGRAQTYAVRIPAERFERGLSAAELPVSANWTVSASGPIQIYVVVRDTKSGRVGSARQFLDFPDFGSGELLLSGIFLNGTAGREAEEYGENPAVRIFQPGHTVSFAYSIFNARVDGEKSPRLETRVRVLREGQQIYSGEVAAASAPDSDPNRRARRANLVLHQQALPGQYSLELTVTDSAASPPRRATQSIDFEVR